MPLKTNRQRFHLHKITDFMRWWNRCIFVFNGIFFGLVLVQRLCCLILYSKSIWKQKYLALITKDKSSTHRLCKQSKTRQFFLVEFSHIPPHIRKAGVKRVNSCPNFGNFYRNFLLYGLSIFRARTDPFDPYFWPLLLYLLFYYYILFILLLF